MSHAGNDISVKRVRFKTSVNPTSTTQLVVGDIPGAGKRGLYLDGELVASANASVSNLQTVTEAGNVTTITSEFNNAYTAISTDLVSNVDVKIDQLYNVEIDNESSGEILVFREQGSSGTQINSNPSDPMTVTFTVVTAPTTWGSADGSISTSVSGATAPYFYTWSTGQITSTLTFAHAG